MKSATLGEELMRQLLLVWLDFERRLQTLPLLRRLQRGTYTLDDHKMLLRNLRPQVVEGARWITRAASSFGTSYLDMRSEVIRHAYDEHRDYEMLERDYQAIGGSLDDIRGAPRNLGTEALSAFLMQQASQPDPVDLLGAMFIIEGLGQKMATDWADRMDQALGMSATSFLRYHGHNDEAHLEKLRRLVDSEAVTTDTLPRIVKTARVTARLYALQLEELDNV